MADTKSTPSFSELLATVASEPGRLEAAFSRFHNYSLGNQLLALGQCFARGIEPGPIATYPAWQALGRQVRKGEKAIELCMPITCKRKDTDEQGEERDATFTRFVFKSRWFVMSQTDGADYVAPAPPTWNKDLALSALDITEVPFDALNGNIQGYATGRKVCVSPIAERAFATLIHEVAHVVLGHTTKGGARLEDGSVIGRAAMEVEAESVALLVLGSLGEDGLEFCRGYVQDYLRGATIAERTAQRIFKAADTILRAGRPADVEEQAAA